MPVKPDVGIIDGSKRQEETIPKAVEEEEKEDQIPTPISANVPQDYSGVRLPQSFRLEVDAEGPLPNTNDLLLLDTYEAVSSTIGATDYHDNLLSFWYVDIVSEAMFRVQNEFTVPAEKQGVMLTWFKHLHSLIFDDQTISRRDVFARLQEAVLSHVADLSSNLPAPEQYGDSAPSDTSLDLDIELRDMKAVMKILYNVFANAFPYSLIQSVLHHPPPISNSEFPYQIIAPKKPSLLLAPTDEPIDKKKKSKSSEVVPGKKGKKGKEKKGKGGKKEKEQDVAPPPEVKTPPTEIPELVKAEKQCYILPLQDAVSGDFFTAIFKAEIEAEVATKATGKTGKGQKKKKKK